MSAGIRQNASHREIYKISYLAYSDMAVCFWPLRSSISPLVSISIIIEGAFATLAEYWDGCHGASQWHWLNMIALLSFSSSISSLLNARQWRCLRHLTAQCRIIPRWRTYHAADSRYFFSAQPSSSAQHTFTECARHYRSQEFIRHRLGAMDRLAVEKMIFGASGLYTPYARWSCWAAALIIDSRRAAHTSAR